MLDGFWKQTAAAFGLAAVPLGIYYFIQDLSGFGAGAGMVAMVGLIVGMILIPVLWVKRTENKEYGTEAESASED